MKKAPIVDITKYGTYAEIGRALGVQRQLVHNWFHVLKRIPAERVHDLSRVTGIPPHKLRPDLFMRPKREK